VWPARLLRVLDVNPRPVDLNGASKHQVFLLSRAVVVPSPCEPGTSAGARSPNPAATLQAGGTDPSRGPRRRCDARHRRAASRTTAYALLFSHDPVEHGSVTSTSSLTVLVRFLGGRRRWRRRSLGRRRPLRRDMTFLDLVCRAVTAVLVLRHLPGFAAVRRSHL
jgi:hypothetical protein